MVEKTKISAPLKCDSCLKPTPFKENWWCARCSESICSFCAMTNHQNHGCSNWQDGKIIKECLQRFRPYLKLMTPNIDEHIRDYCDKLAIELKNRSSIFQEVANFVINVEDVFGYKLDADSSAADPSAVDASAADPSAVDASAADASAADPSAADQEKSECNMQKKLHLVNSILSSINGNFTFDANRLIHLNQRFDFPAINFVADLFFKNLMNDNDLTTSTSLQISMERVNSESQPENLSHKPHEENAQRECALVTTSAELTPPCPTTQMSVNNMQPKTNGSSTKNILRRDLSKRHPSITLNDVIPMKRKRLNNENDALWKPSNLNTPLSGFSNLGNTCYMNAILQALFGLEIFTDDLLKIHLIFKEHLCDKLLLSCLPQLLEYRNNSNQKMEEMSKQLLLKVKSAISVSAPRFTGDFQHDAHEFLQQVLDQLKEEVGKLTTEHSSMMTLTSNPIETNLEFTVSHLIECQNCQNTIIKKETFNDLSLDIPISSDNDDHPISLQNMINKLFLTEAVQFKCESCSSDASIIRHQVMNTPRVLILHIKRYAFDSASSAVLKSASPIVIPKYLTLSKYQEVNAEPFIGTTESSKNINTVEDPHMKMSNKTLDCSSLSPSSAPITSPITPSKVQDNLNGSDTDASPLLNDSRTSINCPYKLRRIQRINYSDAIDNSCPSAERIEDSSITIIEPNITEIELDEDSQLKEVYPIPALERSIVDDELSFQDEIQKAVILSLIVEKDEQSFGIPAELLMDSINTTIETPIIGVDDDPNGTICSSKNGVCSVENASKQVENVDTELKEHTINDNLPNAYHFCGVVSHLGSSSDTGHYIADVYNDKKKLWQNFDDCHVKDTTEEDVQNKCQTSGYIFFYVAKCAKNQA